MQPATQDQRDPLLDLMWDRGLILFGDRVREEYALRTPVFIDLRRRLHEDLDALAQLGAALHQRLKASVDSSVPQQVIGIPDTATPIALAAAMASRGTSLPLAYGQLRKRPASYPGGKSGERAYMGVCDPSREVTLIDDVMASGKTKLWSIDRLKRDGLEVKRILVVVDREQGGDEILAARGVPTSALYSISDLIGYFEHTGRISRTVAEQALEHVHRRRF
jgi:orotate phosphoribosyltransferase